MRSVVAEDLQHLVVQGERGRIMTMDSAYHVDARNVERDVVINASYSGVLPARFIARHRPRAAIGMDCAIGKDGAGIAGLWYLEALGIPAAAADVMTAELGNGWDLYERGVISRANSQARDCGVEPGMVVRQASRWLLEREPQPVTAEERTNRVVVEESPEGRKIVCIDSIAFGLPEDVSSVLCTAGHTGRSAVPYLLSVRPWGFICSDGGMGRDNSGVAALTIVDEYGLPGASVDARTARMGDGVSTYHDGVISARNESARRCGVEVGQPARSAARLLLNR